MHEFYETSLGIPVRISYDSPMIYDKERFVFCSFPVLVPGSETGFGNLGMYADKKLLNLSEKIRSLYLDYILDVAATLNNRAAFTYTVDFIKKHGRDAYLEQLEILSKKSHEDGTQNIGTYLCGICNITHPVGFHHNEER